MTENEKLIIFLFISLVYANKSTRTAWAQRPDGSYNCCASSLAAFHAVLSTPFAKRRSKAHFY